MYAKILVPVDGSDTGQCGLREAIELAKVHQSKLLLVHVVNELVVDASFGTGVYMADVVQSLNEQGKETLVRAQALSRSAGVDSQTVLLESIGGRASDFILAQAEEWKPDLIVMGTHGRRGLRRLAMGSDAEQVVRRSLVPVLLVRSVTQEERDEMSTSGLLR